VSTQTFHMNSAVNAVDPMVLSLRAEVEGVLGDEARFRFELCVTEALVNLVTHTPSRAEDAQIKINLRQHSTAVDVEIFDPEGAEPFDPCANATDLSAIDVMAEGGRGLGLIMHSADAASYGPTDDTNQHSLRLEFRNVATSPEQALPENGALK